MIAQEKTHKQLWVKKEVHEKVESLRIRDETTSSIINFLYEFYIEHKEDI